ncbi:ABC transporter ATP-binding protein [bacterium]|nr:ABC transporter ATP-binding protein [bacterium]
MNSLKYLNKYLLKYKWRLGLGIIFVAISNVFAIYPPQIIREAFDQVARFISKEEVVNNGDMPWIAAFTTDMDLTKSLIFFAVLVMVMALLKGLFTFFTRQTIIIMSRLIEFDLKNEVYAHYQELSMPFYKRNNTGDIMNRISEDVSRTRNYLGPGIMYSINLVTLFIFVISVMLSINVKLTLYALAPLPVLSVLIYYVSNVINKKSEAVQAQLSNLSTLAQETFSGIRILKSFVKEDYANQALDKAATTYKEKNLDLVKTEALFMPIMTLLIGLSTIFTIYIGSKIYIEAIEAGVPPPISPGNIAEFVIYVNMLTWPVTALGWVTSLVQRAAASQRRINEFLETKPEIVSGTTPLQNMKGEIEFKNVGFVYPDSGTKALDGINFKVSPGETLAIIGRTGSGKSTIADLVCRLYDPTSGSVYMDGINLKELDLNALRGNTGYVPQEVFLFSDNIANNIAFGYSEEMPPFEKIERAAKDAAIYDNIMDFPKQFETILGERGITLSGGQKQRISIARAIIKKPKLMIFDDCLSAVDTETEEKILSSLDRIGKQSTCIIISHRVSSVKNANKIIVLDEGRIAEEGTHNQLIEAKGLYFDIYERQLLEDQKTALN